MTTAAPEPPQTALTAGYSYAVRRRCAVCLPTNLSTRVTFSPGVRDSTYYLPTANAESLLPAPTTPPRWQPEP